MTVLSNHNPAKIPASEDQPGNSVDSAGAAEKTCRMPSARGESFELSPDELSELQQLASPELASKQERDFVLAALLMQGNHLTERGLRRVLKSWTPFGERSLREFLIQKGMLTEEVMSEVEQQSRQFLQSLEKRSSWVDCRPTAARRTSLLLEKIDPSGRVAKVFGLSHIPRGAVDNEFRTFRTKYRLLYRLGQGGLGTVWLALDVSLNRYVAIKEILGPAHVQSVAAARFRREAEITGRLDHPSIVPVHILAENEADGRPFYVMRFLGKETLEDAIRDYHERRDAGQATPMGFHRLMTAFGSICQAMAYAHSRKVIHRDLKPQNVALDSFGQVIILDWGLAKMLSGDEGAAGPGTSRSEEGMDSSSDGKLRTGRGVFDNLDVTLAGQVMGTPMYMAPEQAAGRVDEIDEQTDVYGLGAILFAILTGYAPHELSHESLPSGSQMSALFDAIVDRSPTSPRKFNPQIPAALEAICLKAMSKDRYQRYASASALSEDIQRWMANQPVKALPEGTLQRLGRWNSRHRSLSRLLGISALAMALTGGFVAFESYQHREAREQFRIHAVADDTRELQAKLSHEINTLSENVRFLSTLPTAQALVEARQQQDRKAESDAADGLKRIFEGLMGVSPSYVAMTFGTHGIKEAGMGAAGPHVRVEDRAVRHGALRTNLREFLERHSPAILNLERWNVYIGIPGSFGTSAGARGLATVPSGEGEPAGRCLVAGTCVYDAKGGARVGAVVIECDLERLLREHLLIASHQDVEIILTDESGQGVMRFSREGGLVHVAPGEIPFEDEQRARSFLTSRNPEQVEIVSTRLSVARVPLSQADPRKFMGLILRFQD